MEKFYLEYIWLDGYEPQNLRSKIKIAELNADDVEATTSFLKIERPALLINVALPYQDLALMCLRIRQLRLLLLLF